MQAEHARIDPILDACTNAFAGLSTAGVDGQRATLHHSLEDVWQLLDGHLGHEEPDSMEILPRYLTEADWLTPEREHFRPAYSPRDIVRVVPWSQTGLPAGVRQRTLAAGGPAVKVIWRLTRRSTSNEFQLEKGTTMFTEIRKRTRDRRQRASLNRTITAASQPQRDELIVMAQRRGLL